MSNNETKRWYAFLLNPWVITASLTLGIVTGKYFPIAAIKLAFIGQIYLGLLQMVMIPLIVTAITTSFAKIMHSKVEAKIVRRMLYIFVVTLLTAAFIGVIAAIVSKMGVSINDNSLNQIGSLLLQSDQSTNYLTPVGGLINEFVSGNIFAAFAAGYNVPILTFAILLGIALGFVTNQAGQSTLMVFDGLFQSFLILVNGIMYLLPFGLFALLAEAVAKTGFDMFAIAGQLILFTYVIGIILILLFVYIMCKRTKTGFWRTIYHLREMLVISFVSGNSYAALPFGINSLIKDFKLSQTKVNLFFPLSVSLNPIGDAYFLALVVIFIAHLYGHHLSVQDIGLVIILSSVSAVSIGAFPAIAGFSILGMLFTPLGLPSSTAIVLLIALSNILDPILTLTNIVGNATATAILSTPEETVIEEIEELTS